MAIGKVIGRVAIKVLPDTTDFRERTANDLRKIEKQLGDLEVDVIPDIDKAAKERVSNELKAWAEGLNLKVDIDLNLKNGDIAKSTAVLEALARKRTVKIAPELDNGAVAKVAAALAAISGMRYTLDLFRNFRQELMNIDRAVPKIGVVSHAIAGLGAWVLGASGNLFSLSSSLASIGQAGLALPGIFGGIAVGLGTTIAALKDFNVQVPQASRYVHELQDTISQNFWEQAVAPIRELVDKLFPILNSKLAETSTALGGFFAAFSNSAIDLLLPKLGPMFDYLTESIKIASGYTDAFVGIIEKLGTIGASYLPSLAGWFGDIATQFDNWLSKTGTDGLTAMIDNGIAAMKDLGSVTASTFSILSSLGKAATAAGGTTLDSLAASLRNVAAAAASPGFQNGLTATLKSAYDMLTQIRTIAGPALKELVVAMSENFQKVSPIIGDTIGTAIKALASAFAQPEVGKGLQAMFQGFNDMVHTLAPTMDLVAQKFAIMGELIGALARNIGVVMAAAIVTLKPLFIALVEAMLPIVNKVGPMIAQIITALGPVFEILGEALGRAAVALQPLFDQLQKLVNLLLPVLVPALKIVATILGDALVAVIQGLTWVIEGLVKIVSGVISVFKGLGNILAGIFTLDFSQIGEGIKQVFGGLGNIILGFLQGALGAVWAWMNGTVLGFFKGFAAKLLGPIAGPMAGFFEPIAAGARRVMPVIDKLVDFIKTAFAYITSGGGGTALSRLGEVLTYPFQTALTVIRTVFNVIKTVISTAWTVISTIFKTHLTIIQTVVKTAFDLVKLIFTTVFTAIKTFLQVTFAEVSALFTTTWTTISTFLTTTMETIRVGFMLVWDTIKVFLTGTLDFLATRFAAAWEAISAVTSSVFTAIKTVLLTIWNTIKVSVGLYIDAIKTIITTVWNTIKTVTSTVWNSIKSLITDAVNGIKGSVSGAWNTISSTTSGAWNTIKSTLSSAWSSMKTSVTTGVSDAITEVKKLPTKAVSALAGIGSILINAGKDLIGGFISGIKDKFKDVKGVLGDLTGSLTSWKGPESLDKVLLVGAGHLIIDGLIRGFEDKFTSVRSMLTDLTNEIAGFIGKSMSEQISDALSFAMTGDVATSITANASIQSVNLDRRLGGLERQITTAARQAADAVASGESLAPIQIGNITIPLEDLEQLKTLEEFMELLRVRIRQG